MKKNLVKIGEVGVDSGQLLICDPMYIDQQWKRDEKTDSEFDDHAHEIYQHVEDKSLWQFTYNNKFGGNKKGTPGINPFPKDYATKIKEYGMSPNELIEKKIFVKTDIDPTPHIPIGEFSYRSICKGTLRGRQAAQLNYDLGHPGVGVAFSSGLGDGCYNVYAEYSDCGPMGTRITAVHIVLVEPWMIEELQKASTDATPEAGD